MQYQLTLDSYLDNPGTGAVIDETGIYRYSLWREWDHSKPKVAFVMLNPSKADHMADDPTIRRCISFSRSWGFGSLEVVNLFAFRATDPKELLSSSEPIGRLNDDYIIKAIKNANLIILAWGTKGSFKDRNEQVLKLMSGEDPHCLEITKEGHPKHPLYVGNWAKPSRYKLYEKEPSL